MIEQGGHSGRLVSAYLGGLAGIALVTAISPLFFFSWPYLAIAAVPTIRWFRRRRDPISRGMLRWIVVLAALMTSLPLSTAAVYVAKGHIDATETWALVVIGLVFAPFLIAARRRLELASRRGADDEPSVAPASPWTTPLSSDSLRPMSEADDLQRTVSVGDRARVLITLGPVLPRAADEYDLLVEMSIEGPGLHAHSVVRLMDGAVVPYCLRRFLQELADDWKGAEPKSDFVSIENDLSIVATRDEYGHVVMRFTLRESFRPDAWEVSASVSLDAGEEMAAVARDVKALLA